MSRSSQDTLRLLVPGLLCGLLAVACDDGSKLDGELVLVERQTRDLKVTSIDPTSGPLAGSTLVVMTGEGFEPEITIRFGDRDGTRVYVGGDELLAVLTPAGLTPGPVDVTLARSTDEQTTTVTGGFTYEPDPPPPADLLVTEVLPPSGGQSGGNRVTVAGQGFQEGAEVSFGGVPATEERWLGPDAISVLVPAGAEPGRVSVRVDNPDGDSHTLDLGYQYVSEAPLAKLELLAVIPSAGPVTGGNQVTIQGRGIREGATVRFGTTAATDVRVLGASALVCTAPPSATAELVDVTVENLPDEDDASPSVSWLEDAYRYTEVPADVVSVLATIPPEGPLEGGNVAVIQGTGFVSGMKVFFDGVAATQVQVLGPNAVTCRVPAATVAGAVTVRVELPAPAQGVAGEAAERASGYTYLPGDPALLVLRAIPAQGPQAGGNVVALEGTGFRNGARVYVGAGEATQVQVLGPTALTFTAPPAVAAGLVAIRVELPPLEGEVAGESSRLEGAYTYLLGGVVVADFSVASLFPPEDAEAGGALVFITGTGFDPAMVVRFGQTQSPLVQVLSSNAATALVPPGVAGLVDVTLIHPNSSSVTLTNGFRYVAEGTVDLSDPPALGAILPSRGPTAGGTLVRIAGQNLAPDLRVFFGANEASEVAVHSPTQASAIVPAGAAGSVAVRVQNPDGKDDALAGGFLYNDTATTPTIAATWPATGPTSGGTWVEIEGAAFADGTTVWFGMSPATTMFVDASHLVAVAPAGEVGSVDLRVVRADGAWARAADAFAWFDVATLPAEPPVVGGVFPSLGDVLGGERVAVVGSGFAPGARVWFGSQRATIVEGASPNQLVVTTPAHATGAVTVTVTNPSGLTSSRRDAFVYFAAPPVIVTVDPGVAAASGGSEIAVRGKNFAPNAVVRLGDDVSITTFNSRTPRELRFFAPAHAPATLDVHVDNPDGQSDVLEDGFAYVPDDQFGAPVVTSIEPQQGLATGGYLALIRGDAFQAGASVTFGTAQATQVMVLGPSAISARVPAGLVNATVDVTVANSAQKKGTLPQAFTYTAAPVGPIAIRAVAPGSGSIDGGTVITITGEGFEAGSTVLVGGEESPAVDVISPNVITAVTPAAEQPGLADVRVQRPDLSGATAFNAFAYFDPDTVGRGPNVFAVDPVLGPLTGGTTVMITGQRFAGPVLVFFGATEATSVTVLDSGRIVARTPAANAPGTVAVSVINFDGLTGVAPGAFSYYDASNATGPTVGGVLPSEGSVFGETPITVVGQNMSAGTRIYICNRPATLTSVQGSNLSLLTPAGSPGPCTIAAVNADGLWDDLPDGFRYVSPNPIVGDVVPRIGPIAGNIDVVITGDDFVPGAQVRFGNAVSTQVTVADATTLTARLPASTLGLVDVTVINPGGKSGTKAAAFEYVDSVTGIPPTILAIQPASGPLSGGTPVQVLGQNFSPGALLLFGQQAIPGRAFISTSEIRFTTPAAMGAGAVPITVLNPDGLGATVPNGFTYADPQTPPPEITSVVPSTGREAGGTTITITGKFFDAQGTWTLGGKPLDNVATVTSNLVTARTPPGAPGTRDLVYVGPDGQVALRLAAFEYLAAPRLTAVTPGLGNKAGGAEVTLVGDNFASGMQVFFGPNVGTILSTTTTTALARVPSALVSGFVNVRVRNPDGQEATLTNGFEYLDSPTITSVWPPRGPSVGGTLTHIEGTGFHPLSRVLVGPNESVEVHYASPTLLFAFTPAGALGTVTVKVINPDGREIDRAEAFQYTDPGTLGPAPVIGELFPARGPTTGGTKVSLDGASFQPDARVVFLSSRASLDYLGASRAIAVAPPHPAGPSRVYLTNPDGQTIRALEDFTYIDPGLLGVPPTLSNVDPRRGPTAGNTRVTIVGQGFQSGARVRFGPWDSETETRTATQMTVFTPASQAGSASIWLVNPDGTQGQAPSSFLFLPPPEIFAISPSRAPASGNVSVTISGRNLKTDPDGLEPEVLFCTDYALDLDCAAANPTFLDVNGAGTELTFLAPPHTPAITDVVVIAPDGQLDVATSAFTYSALPSIVSIEPDSGPTGGGTTITVRGNNIQQGAIVRLAGNLCTETNVQDATTLVCKTPAGAIGPVEVVLTNPDSGSVKFASGFTYVPPPDIISMIPNVGPQNATTPIQATITGFHFKQGLTVWVGSNQATNVVVNGSTSITFAVPTNGMGSNDVKVINPDGQQDVLLDGFTYIPPLPPPQINFITPNTGITLGGDEFRISGLAFLDGVRVFFGDGEASSIVLRNSGTLIVGRTPAATAGVVDVKVVNSDGQQDIALGAFEYVPPAGTVGLKFFAIEPTRSILNGGGRFTLSGEGFQQNVAVRFIKDEANAAFATDVVRLGPTLITGTLPPAPGGVAGKVTVRVLNPFGEYIDAPNAFEYVNGPVFVRHPGDRLPNEPHNDLGAVVFDANNDGLNDVLVFTTTINRLLINGYEGRDGSFQEVPFAPNYGGFGTTFAIARDFDGDTDIDIVRHRSNVGHVQFCRNEGGGNFPTCVDIANYTSCSMRRIVVDYLDCDDELDIFLPFNSTSTSCLDRVFLGRGNGSFLEAPLSVIPNLPEQTTGAAAGDVDADGDTDLVLANDANEGSKLYLNNCANLQDNGSCEPGIPHFTMASFGGHTYAMSPASATGGVPATLSWQDAESYCRSYGYELVRVDSVEEHNFLKTGLRNTNSWIGYKDVAGNNVYEWSSGGASSFSTGWCLPGEPDTPSYDCAYFEQNATTANRCWRDYPCTNSFHFVCESPTPSCASPWKFENATYGTLDSGAIFPVSASNARDVLLVDIDQDQDKDLDVVIANWGQPVNVYLNVGGRFTSHQSSRWPINEPSMFIDRLITADIEGDGDIDIVAEGNNNEIRLYVNQLKEFQFAAFANETAARWPSESGLDSRTDLVDFAVGDLDGDALPDLYLVGATYTDRLVMNRGYAEGLPWIDSSRVPIGRFAFNTFRSVPERRYDGRGAKLGDLNGDGALDIVKCGWRERLSVYFNDGAGKFVDMTDEVLPFDWYYWCANMSAIELIDLDNDNDLDIVYEGAIHWSSCNPQTTACSGRLQLINNLATDYRFDDVAPTNMPYALQAYANTLAFADMDQDGDKDQVVLSFSSSASQMYVNGGDVWNVGGTYFFYVPSWFTDPANGVAVTASAATDIGIVDLNGDNYPDLFVGRHAQNLVLLNVDGRGLRNVTQQYANVDAYTTNRLLVEDFDKDGDDDIVLINQSQPQRFLLRQENDYANQTQTAFSTQITDNSRDGVAGDFDQDQRGLVDFVVANYNEQNRLWINQGSGQFLHLTANLPTDVMYTYGVMQLDVDDDGDLDLYWVNEDQDRIYINTIIP
ncbi:MAG: IPT/TIG domain-containing protein [Deltaproteobacteria bacterium]|nr:IPT/TIG domain-containing protein [Deltaproteobacteria bacterium]